MPSTRVVVTGLGTTSPVGGDVPTTWQALLAGTSGIGHLSDEWAESLPVKIAGRVADSYSVADRGVYRIQDGSGELWVVSDHGVPRTGARVSVKGHIREAFNLGILGRGLPAGVGSGLVLVETSHSAR